MSQVIGLTLQRHCQQGAASGTLPCPFAARDYPGPDPPQPLPTTLNSIHSPAFPSFARPTRFPAKIDLFP